MHLASTKVVDRGVPFLMKALARVAVFIQRRAIELCQSVHVGRKVAWHPIQNDANAGRMAAIHEPREVAWLTKTGLRRVLAQDLISPGATEGVSHDGQQF